jgi:hypothetical protein
MPALKLVKTGAGPQAKPVFKNRLASGVSAFQEKNSNNFGKNLKTTIPSMAILKSQ